jgi:hypothetical protein
VEQAALAFLAVVGVALLLTMPLVLSLATRPIKR